VYRFFISELKAVHAGQIVTAISGGHPHGKFD
jgi:hypothetical protein